MFVWVFFWGGGICWGFFWGGGGVVAGSVQIHFPLKEP